VSPGAQSIRDAFELATLAAIGKLNAANGVEKRSPFRSSKGKKKFSNKYSSPLHNNEKLLEASELSISDIKNNRKRSKCSIVWLGYFIYKMDNQFIDLVNLLWILTVAL